MMVFISWTVLVLILVLPLVLLCSLVAMIVKKYRRHLPKAVMICFVLFAVQVAADFLIYRDLVRAMNEPSGDGIFLDIHPFDTMLMFSLNWNIPGMVVLIAGTLILTRKMKKSVLFWICLGATAILMCGFFVLAYLLYNWFGSEELLQRGVWWL